MNAGAIDFTILLPAFVAGLLVTLTHVPLGVQVLARGIVFIDLAIAQIAGCGVILADRLGFDAAGASAQVAALLAAVAGALLLTWTERRWPDAERPGGAGSGKVSAYSRDRESSHSVTGPSLTSATCMFAPKTPVRTGRPLRAASILTNASNSGCAMPGGAARDHDGRLPLRVDAYSVNCETASSDPCSSTTERFITPASSSNIRTSAIFRASHSPSSGASSAATPTRTSSPAPIWLTTPPSTVTLASRTRCASALIAVPP